ncbi:hypothetical protein H8E07_02005 [bacterium]|nr:hypothetical protein [bacterium]
MTCGDEECQQQRHAKRCKWWHERNAEASANHYIDVVKPYRCCHPSYQRRWRLMVALRKIREEMLSMARRSGRQLAHLVSRGRRVIEEGASEPVQARAMTGKPLEESLAKMASMVKTVDELTTLAGELAVLGGTL